MLQIIIIKSNQNMILCISPYVNLISIVAPSRKHLILLAVIQRIELWSLARQASIITPILYHHVITYINQLFCMILSLFLKNRLKPHRIYGFCIPLPFAMHQYTPTFADRLLLSALPLESNQTYFHSTRGGQGRA